GDARRDGPPVGFPHLLVGEKFNHRGRLTPHDRPEQWRCLAETAPKSCTVCISGTCSLCCCVRIGQRASFLISDVRDNRGWPLSSYVTELKAKDFHRLYRVWHGPC